MHHAATGDSLLLGLSALSQLSRNSTKLLRVLEFFLAHQARILTTNYMLTATEVSVRRNTIIKPNSTQPMPGFRHVPQRITQEERTNVLQLAAHDST